MWHLSPSILNFKTTNRAMKVKNTENDFDATLES